MKVFTKKGKKVGYEFPEDMDKILGYLSENGTIHVPGEAIADLYAEFSEREFFAGWMNPSGDVLPRFADWLEERELTPKEISIAVCKTELQRQFVELRNRVLRNGVNAFRYQYREEGAKAVLRVLGFVVEYEYNDDDTECISASVERWPDAPEL